MFLSLPVSVGCCAVKFDRAIFFDFHVSAVNYRAVSMAQPTPAFADPNPCSATTKTLLKKEKMMIGADSFSSSYSEARDKFQEAVVATGGRAESFKHPGSGPGGEELATDAAWFGPRRHPGFWFYFGHPWRRRLLWFRRSDRLVAPRGIQSSSADTGVLISRHQSLRVRMDAPRQSRQR